ncbi:hypothetical protein K445DRAFT_318069 [Daldinia sp. EC12]|nr:hypothetical protein K445DRAFT_318069 [Daldinia sp. EC12]
MINTPPHLGKTVNLKPSSHTIPIPVASFATSPSSTPIHPSINIQNFFFSPARFRVNPKQALGNKIWLTADSPFPSSASNAVEASAFAESRSSARPLVSVSRYAPQLSAGPLPFSFVASLRQARSGFGNPAISMLKYQIYSLSDQGGAIMSKELECFLCLILGHGGPVMIYYSWHITMGIEGNLMDQE